MEQQEKILEVKNLRVNFNTYAGKIQAVRGVSFSLYKGETLAIVGESGCGKTVTSKALLRLYQPPLVSVAEGSEILYDGQDVLKMNKKQLQVYRGREVGMIFQDPMTSLNPTMKVGDQIAEALRIHNKISKKEAAALAVEKLRLVDIPNPEKRAECYPHQLSGGMRQRVVIAIALSCSPKIIIADEPTTALDVTIQAQILDLLMEIREKTHTAIILVTHDLGVVANFASRIQVMYAGQIVERGSTRDLFYQPRHPYTRALLDSVPKLSSKTHGELYSLKGTPPDLILELKGCPFAARCQYCMPVCQERMPEEIDLGEGHSVSCWLQHPMAPDVGPLNHGRKAGA